MDYSNSRYREVVFNNWKSNAIASLMSRDQPMMSHPVTVLKNHNNCHYLIQYTSYLGGFIVISASGLSIPIFLTHNVFYYERIRIFYNRNRGY